MSSPLPATDPLLPDLMARELSETELSMALWDHGYRQFSDVLSEKQLPNPAAILKKLRARAEKHKTYRDDSLSSVRQDLDDYQASLRQVMYAVRRDWLPGSGWPGVLTSSEQDWERHSSTPFYEWALHRVTKLMMLAGWTPDTQWDEVSADYEEVDKLFWQYIEEEGTVAGTWKNIEGLEQMEMDMIKMEKMTPKQIEKLEKKVGNKLTLYKNRAERERKKQEKEAKKQEAKEQQEAANRQRRQREAANRQRQAANRQRQAANRQQSRSDTQASHQSTSGNSVSIKREEADRPRFLTREAQANINWSLHGAQ